MPVSALVLVLAAALLHASWNVAAKRSGGDARFALLGSLMHVVLWAPIGIWAAWGVVPAWHLREWLLLLLSAIVHTLYITTLLRGYRAADLTVVYPVARGSGPLLASLGAIFFFGERVSPLAAVGIAGVGLGVFFIAGGPSLWRRARGQERGRRVRAGLLWGALTGCLISGYTLVDGYAVKVLLISPILVDYLGELFRVPMLLPAAWREGDDFADVVRRQWRPALVVATLGPLGYILVLYAVQLAPLSHVAPAREVSMLFAALLGGRLLGEGERASRLAGAGCIAAGVSALALG